MMPTVVKDFNIFHHFSLTVSKAFKVFEHGTSGNWGREAESTEIYESLYKNIIMNLFRYILLLKNICL